MLEKGPGSDYDGSRELEDLVREALEIGMERIRDRKAPFQPFLIAVINGERGESKCTHADYRQALAALKHEAESLPPATERYAVAYYGTLEYHNALFVEAFEGKDARSYKFAQKFKRKGLFDGQRVARGRPEYLGRYHLMNPVPAH